MQTMSKLKLHTCVLKKKTYHTNFKKKEGSFEFVYITHDDWMASLDKDIVPKGSILLIYDIFLFLQSLQILKSAKNRC